MQKLLSNLKYLLINIHHNLDLMKLPELNNINLEDIWFQQYDAIPYSANEEIELLKEKCYRILIYDLVKCQVYENNPQ